MTQESKELLLKDLSGRLPYGVKVSLNDGEIVWEETLSSICISDDRVYVNGYCIGSYLEEVKPYLFPPQSLPQAQKDEICEAADGMEYGSAKDCIAAMVKVVKLMNKYHVDYRGLIEMGSAINATGLNIYKNEK